jgi:hypothetical protein
MANQVNGKKGNGQLGALTGYFLEVDILVPTNRVHDFETAVKSFLKKTTSKNGKLPQPFTRLVEDATITFVLGLRTPAFTYESRKVIRPGYIHQTNRDLKGGTRMRRYVHIWSVPDLEASNLVQVMQRSADDPFYIAIDKEVARETQDFVYQVQWPLLVPSGTAALAVPRSTRNSIAFVRTIHQYASSDLGTALFKLGSSFPVMSQANCTAVGTFQSVTGTLDSVTQYWRIPGTPERALRTYEAARKRISSRIRAVDFSSLHEGRSRIRIDEAFEVADYSPSV